MAGDLLRQRADGHRRAFGLAYGSLVAAWFLGNIPQTQQLAVAGARHHTFLAVGVSPSSRRCRSGRCGRKAKASAGAGKPTLRDWRHPCNGSNFCRLTWADSVSTRAPTFAAMRRGVSCGEVVMRGRTRVRLLRGDRCPPTHARHPRVPARAPGPARAVSPAIRRVRAGASGWRRPAAQRRCARRGVAAVAMDFCCVASSLPHDNCIDAGRGSSVGRIRRRTFPT